MTTPQTAMKDAVAIVNTSPHPTNKISSTIFHETAGWALSRTNFWPSLIAERIGTHTDIGNSSGTIHAETACLFAASFEAGLACEGASIAITDPPCPNCVKNMAEAGIKNIYIDHKGFLKDYAERRFHDYHTLSQRLAEKAGINIFEMNRKNQTIRPLISADLHYKPANEKPLTFILKEDDFISLTPPPFEQQAMAFCTDQTGQKIQIISASHPALGYDSDSDDYEITHPQTKYSFIQEACNRLLMNAARRGLRIINNEIYMASLPTSREMVNCVGAGIQTLHIMRPTEFRDDHARRAKKQLSDKSILLFPDENSIRS